MYTCGAFVLGFSALFCQPAEVARSQVSVLCSSGPITYSRLDTLETKRQIDRHNRVYVALCRKEVP